MMPETSEYTTDSESRAWDAVTEHLEAFASAWETQGSPPDTKQFVPANPPSVRRLVLIELVKLDLDFRLQRGLDRPIEEYLQEFPELDQNGPPCDLLYEDFHLRKQCGQDVVVSEYFRRFPQQASELAGLLGSGTLSQSSSVYSARAPEDVHPGDTVDDFDLLALLGQGQFAKVFLARQRTMQRLVALKVSARRGAEAQTLAQLNHPHIVHVFDQRYIPDRSLQLVYMTYLAGGTLSDVVDLAKKTPPEERSGKTLLAAVDESLHRRGEVPSASSSSRQVWAARSWTATVCALGVKLASALDYAHQHQVLHRDVKPANVLLTSEGEPMLADFNVGCCSKLEGAGPAAFFGGSLAYMAPEHIEAFNPEHERPPESLDGRADIFGLAVTLWELVTGSRPFGAEELRGSWPETLKALVEQRRAGPKPEAIAAFDDGDVPGLREVLLSCLEFDPEKRPANGSEMARELDLCLRPKTHKLVRPKPSRWRSLVLRHPLSTLINFGLAPNILASAFNIFYNYNEIVLHWPKAEPWFIWGILWINAIFFPIGMWLFYLAFRPTMAGLRAIRDKVPPDLATLKQQRLSSLRMGSAAVWSCVIPWTIAGLIFPIWITLNAGWPPQGIYAYLHFLISLLICGLIAGSYPYFIVTHIAVRFFYPALLGGLDPTREDKPALQRIGSEITGYQAAAAAVPFVGVPLALLAVRSRTHAVGAQGIDPLIYVAILCLLGLLGVAMAYVMVNRTKADIAALADMTAKD